jgi:hypothetical protein
MVSVRDVLIKKNPVKYSAMVSAVKIFVRLEVCDGILNNTREKVGAILELHIWAE